MRILVVGSDGFIGRNVVQALEVLHEVQGISKDTQPRIDLMDKQSITTALKQLQPEVIINAAGVVGNDADINLNRIFTTNLLDAATEYTGKVKRIIITGSAAEYGVVDPADIPVGENTPRNAASGYGLSKLQEVDAALKLAKNYGLPVTIARVFNPIGAGMHPKFLVPGILRQLDEVKRGKQDAIEVSRLDTKRDYIDIRDVAAAYRSLAEGKLQHDIYNIGSGKATSNQELVEYIVEASGVEPTPRIIETASEPEPLVAIQADISRISGELGWQPLIDIRQSIEEIVSANR